MRRTYFCLSVLPCVVVLLLGTAHASDTTPRFQPWTKRGVILTPGFAGPRSVGRVTAPAVVRLDDGRLRMYFWATSQSVPRGRGQVFAAEASPGNPFSWQLIREEPVFQLEPRTDIRDFGPGYPFVVPRRDGPWLMYYGTWASWEPGEKIDRTLGLAVSEDEGITWREFKETAIPIGKPGSYDAGIVSSSAVLRTSPNEYFIWYTAGERYQKIGEINRGIVHIGVARSTDGLDWVKEDQPALRARLDTVDPFEAVVSKPSVIKLDGVYHMWFSVFRMEGGGYRLGYARSTDGLKWHRHPDEEILPLSPGEFDSRNQAYPCVIDMGQQLWMFYTGDDFGNTGIGLATLDKNLLR